MRKAVKVRIAGQEWNKDVRKYFPSSKTYLVADPSSSLVEGDVIRMSSGWRTSKSIRHVVTAIVSPFGKPINERPPIPTEEERIALRVTQRLEKDVRAAERGRRTSKLRLQAAKEKGYEIPDLEAALRNVRIREAEEAAKGNKGTTQAHTGQVGQVLTAKERRRQDRERAKGERKAEAEAKRSKKQTI
ncbi:uncharacterized protein BDR25DRAFT_308945 [Lindgomyces ingoldianus]|uniref:Uncharacterized protein n=1 Tax=Lindgomyces ingoldianus TaxID=673940 RepID=A0ACB6RFU2_9PLEO|nr:uncharacterized protein BDR25DRAFT_308945 [Lindgomyces ingoldianus]KAF2478134.1 hypothetical protein BDR25DRAFT_308945 [Lindgomyces ingoldianus]